MRTSMLSSSLFSVFIASLIFTTGEVSEMLLPRSSSTRCTSASSSVTRPSSLVSSLIASLLLPYRSCTSPSRSRTRRYSMMSASNWLLRKRSRVATFSSSLDTSALTLSRCTLLSGSSCSISFLWLCACSRWLRQSLVSAASVIFSLGPTRSSSSFHSAGSTLASICATESSSSASADLAAEPMAAASPAPPRVSMYASSSSSDSASAGILLPCITSMPGPCIASSRSSIASSGYPSAW
mmetsp:Transcript_44443/g.111580  ORF Transcript_44443/g.111580 Transcript_44443/m.111580 type:complete len:239 (-) Transcript_44443:984-1700(-)